jgi:hypothetical protein
MSTAVIHYETSLQIYQNALFHLTQIHKKTDVEREFSALYILYKHLHAHLLLLDKHQTTGLLEIVASRIMSLSLATVHVYKLVLENPTDQPEFQALNAVLHAGKLAGYQANTAPICCTDLLVCLDNMYNILSRAIADIVRPETL